MARTRPKKVEVRMTEEEFEAYNKKAQKSKLSKQEYGLKCLLNKNIVVVDGIVDLAFQIRKIGVNINQVVHLCQQNKIVNPSDVEDLDNKVSEVWNLLNKFVKDVKK